MTGWFQTVWPVATFFLGGLAKFAADERKESRQLNRERDAKTDKLADRRETFELSHLVDLTEALTNLSRAVAQAHFADLAASKETGKYASTLLPDGVSDGMLAANRKVYMLKGLVLDDSLREAVSEAHSLLGVPNTMHLSDPDKATQAMNKAVYAVDRAQGLIAERIRHIYLRLDNGGEIIPSGDS